MEKEDIPVATIKVDSVNGSDVAVESAGRAEPVLSPEALDELMAKVEANGLELLGPDGVLADLTKRIIERALDDERTHHLGYERGDPAGRGSGNSRNGAYPKAVLTDIGAVDIEVPRDRNGTFEPKLVPPHSSRLAGFNERIISLYAGGMTVRDIRRHLKQIYGIEVSPDLISTVTDGIVEELNEWQTRALDPVYPIMYIDALVVKVRDQGTVVNKPAYQVIGVDVEGRKHVLGIWMGDGDEGAKFWLAVLTEVKNRGVADVLIVCCDGLKGLPDAIETTWPQAVVQTCVIHLIRGSTRYCSYKDRKAVAQALRPIYTAVNEEAAAEALDDFELMWGDRYPGIVRLWRSAWERFTPFLAYPAELRKIVYTTNLIESVNFQLRKVSKNRGHFPNDAAALKLLRLVARDITTTRGGAAGTGTYAWKTALNILDIHFPNRLVFNT
jgi:putative transposase